MSGSSTGAAFFAAALRDAGETGDIPCSKEKLSPLVFRNHPPNTWRECMEVLLSGDFLSSTVFAYVYKDAIRGLAAIAGRAGIPLPDRAAVLEAAWEEHYCKYTSGACCDGTACAENDFKGMSRLFLSVAGFKPQDKWFPLLFFNTTDVDTGRRVIVSSVAPKTCVRDGSEINCVCDETLDKTHKCNLERLLPDAYDLHQLLADQPGDEGREIDKQGAHIPAGRLPRDLRLSTAAGLSARFPFVSPVGNVTNNDKRLVARVVDGGYFENFGAATAYDIAYRLQELKLDPLIIEITNDPELFGALVVTPPKDQDPPLADGDLCNIDFRDPVCAPEPAVIQVNGDYFFSGIRGPLSGLFGGRNAQGGRALWQLANISGKKKNGCLPSDNPGDRHFVHFYVHPQYVYSETRKACVMENVSMSWWLSKPVQAYLDNEVTNADLITVLDALRTPAPPAPQATSALQPSEPH